MGYYPTLDSHIKVLFLSFGTFLSFSFKKKKEKYGFEERFYSLIKRSLIEEGLEAGVA